MSRTAVRLGIAGLALAAATSVVAAFVPSAAAVTTIPVKPNPYPCVYLIGTPNPCPPTTPPTHTPPPVPTPVDPSCLRVDVAPLHCPYLP